MTRQRVLVHVLVLVLAGCKDKLPPPPPPLDASPACTEGALTCSDAGMLRCAAGALLLVSTCRGPAGCGPGGLCDDSLAEEGDVCDTPRQPACSVDRASELFCEDGGYAKKRACIHPCVTLDGGIRCD